MAIFRSRSTVNIHVSKYYLFALTKYLYRVTTARLNDIKQK